VVDHEHFGRRALRQQFQPELFLQRGEHRHGIGSCWLGARRIVTPQSLMLVDTVKRRGARNVKLFVISCVKLSAVMRAESGPQVPVEAKEHFMQVTIIPDDARIDEPVAIRLTGLAPQSLVQLRLRNHVLKAESRADFVASANGIVDVAVDSPVAGDYAGVDPGGLFWSARFDAGADVVSMIDALTQLKPLTYTLAVTGSADGVMNFRRRLLPTHVVQTPVRDGRVRGTLFAHEGLRNAPGVIVLGGSDGGNVWTFVAALLAAHGMAALSLAYFAYDDLPRELVEIPIEYFAEAIDWLRRRPEVGATGIGVLGMSYGGEAALLTGAFLRGVGAVVALVASGVTSGGIGADFSAMGKSAWTRNGVPFPVFPPPGDPLTFDEAQRAIASGAPFAGAPAMLRALQSAGERVEDVAIPVERTPVPILMISAEDDRLWASSSLTEIAERRLRRANFPHFYEHVRYPNAGHFAVLLPNLPTTSNSGRHPVVPMTLAFGGTPDANARASADMWPRVVSFLRTCLAAPREG
jgi:dienelactone hydrolase